MLKITTGNKLKIYHVKFSFANKSESDDCAGGHREVGVDDSAVLTLANSDGAVEARPEQPQEDCTYKNTRLI